MLMKKEEIISNKANKYAEIILKSTTNAGSGHASSALSLIHIIAGIMTLKKFNAVNPFDRKTNDVIILSEGHAVPVLYSAWAVEGFNYFLNGKAKQLSVHDVENALRSLESPLDGHPSTYVELSKDVANLPFASATGALGQGLSIANGIALADRLDKIKRNIFVVCGDSEFREGQIDEALRFANTYKLNITLFLNLNEWGQSAKTKDLVKHDYKRELIAKNWDVLEINGHNVKQIVKVLSKNYSKPTAILAHTIKGWIVKELQGDNHARVLPKEQLSSVLSRISRSRIIIPKTKPMKITHHDLPSVSLPIPKFSGNMSARKGYGCALLELGKRKDVVVCDAEVSNSTMTQFFKKKYPGRFVECSIAEQNMMSVASGMASQCKIVFVNTFSRFLETCFSQWNISLQSRIPLHVVGSHVGLGPYSDGPSQMGLADLSYALSFPNLVVFSSSDAVSAYYLAEECVNLSQPTYLRNYRPDTSLLYGVKDDYFRIGGSKILRKGKDCLIVAHGFMVHVALEAAKDLEKNNISVGVIDAYSLKPLDEKTILAESEKTRRVITLEDNYLALGNLVASLIAGKNIQLKQLFVKRWPKSARKIEEMLDYCGISKEDVVKVVKSF